MQNKSFAEGRSPGLRRVRGENDPTGTGSCAFPCRVENTQAQWLDADSLIRLPLRGQRRTGFQIDELHELEQRTGFPIKSGERKYAGYPRQCYPGSI